MITSSLSTLHKQLRAKEISARELTEAHLAHIHAKNPELNAYLHVSDAHALAQADVIDTEIASGTVRSPLAGIPMAIKDSICTKGIPTTAASRMLEHFVPPYNATCAQRLEDAGAILLGKTNTDEFTSGSSTEHSAFGPTRNPHDTTKVPGGSSGGSAAAVVANMAVFALGTDTGGSIRLPASFCGCVGLKVTYGRVSRSGVIAMGSSYDTIGPMTRTVEDCALVLEHIAGQDSYDSTTPAEAVPRYSEHTLSSFAGVRIGVPKEYFGEGIDPEVRQAVEASIRQAEAMGATIQEVSLPHTKYALAVYYLTQPAEQSANLARFDGLRFGNSITDPVDLDDLYLRNRSLFGEEIKRRIIIGTYVLSHGYYDAYYKKAQQVRRLVMEDFTTVFKDVDVLMTPVAPYTAFAIGSKTDDPLAMYMADVMTVPINAAGVPALSLPCGKDSTGMPIGLQLIGPHFSEEKLLAYGRLLEQI